MGVVVHLIVGLHNTHKSTLHQTQLTHFANMTDIWLAKKARELVDNTKHSHQSAIVFETNVDMKFNGVAVKTGGDTIHLVKKRELFAMPQRGSVTAKDGTVYKVYKTDPWDLDKMTAEELGLDTGGGWENCGEGDEPKPKRKRAAPRKKKGEELTGQEVLDKASEEITKPTPEPKRKQARARGDLTLTIPNPAAPATTAAQMYAAAVPQQPGQMIVPPPPPLPPVNEIPQPMFPIF